MPLPSPFARFSDIEEKANLNYSGVFWLPSELVVSGWGEGRPDQRIHMALKLCSLFGLTS